jgi:hypothetical protein
MTNQVFVILENIRILWNQLEKDIQSSSTITGDSTKTYEILSGARIGLDKKNNYHLLLNLKKGEDPLRTRLTHGISIETKPYEYLGEVLQTIDIVSDKRWRFAIEPFAAEVISRMKNGVIDLKTLRETVDEHRSLWEAPREPLSASEQRGLIGELTTIKRLGSIIPAASIVSRWRGPERGIHDISDSDYAIEVKTYSEEPPRVKINHIEQLDHRMDKKLTLIGIHLIKSEEGISLPEYIDEIRIWASEKGCLDHIDEQLRIARWRDEDRNEYYSRYILGRTVICPIRPESPVFPVYLSSYIPSSVTNISYYLKLNDLSQLSPDIEDNWKKLVEKGAWESIDKSLTPDELINSECLEIHNRDVNDLISTPESSYFEVKSSTWHSYSESSAPKSELMKKLELVIVKSVSGFLNSKGGTLLIGLSDDPREILGLELDLKSRNIIDTDQYENTLSQILSSRLSGGIGIISQCVKFTFPEINGKILCRIDIKPSSNPVFGPDDKFYVRTNNRTPPMDFKEIVSYCITHWNVKSTLL